MPYFFEKKILYLEKSELNYQNICPNLKLERSFSFMGIIIAIIVGAIVGWIASKIMGTDSQQGTIANIVVGIIGAFLAQFIFGNVLGIGSAASAGTFSLFGILWGIIGAVILIVVLKALRVFK